MSVLHTNPNLSESVPSLEESVKEIGRLVKEPSDLDQAELPGLDGLIDDWYNENVTVDEEEFMRKILGVFKESTHREVYDHVVAQFSPSQQDAINDFVSGQIAAEDAAKVLVPQEPFIETVKTKVPDSESHVQLLSIRKQEPIRTNIRVRFLFAYLI